MKKKKKKREKKKYYQINNYVKMFHKLWKKFFPFVVSVSF